MKHILSIDGGGARILIAIYFLHCLELYLKKKIIKKIAEESLDSENSEEISEEISIHDYFDIYAGTSSGAMLISCLSHLKKDLDFIRNEIFSKSNMEKMFLKNYWPLSYFGLDTKYSSKGKTKLIKKYNPENLQMNSTNKIALIIGYNVSQSTPMFFKSYEVNMFSNDLNTIVDISSAAPSYFPLIQFKNEKTNINEFGCDGGIVSLNPTDCILADAIKLYPNDKFKVLSLGLGSYSFDKKGINNNWGQLQWLFKGHIIDRLSTTNTKTVDYRTKVFCKSLGHEYLRIDINDLRKIKKTTQDSNIFPKKETIVKNISNTVIKELLEQKSIESKDLKNEKEIPEKYSDNYSDVLQYDLDDISRYYELCIAGVKLFENNIDLINSFFEIKN